MQVISNIEQVLYIDLQAQVPGEYCGRCGGACYAPGYVCIRCERDRP